MRVFLAAVVGLYACAYAMRTDGATMPRCTAESGPVVWYVPALHRYWARGSIHDGVGAGKYVCVARLRTGPYYHPTPPPQQTPMPQQARIKINMTVTESTAVTDSVYDTLARTSRHERPGYGRYTYVLLTTESETARNTALLRSIMETTPTAASVNTNPQYLNVFELPETSKYDPHSKDATNAAYALKNYDFGFAHDLLASACAAPDRPKVCNGSLTGPFLLTYGRPLASLHHANPPYLIVDLHYLNPKGFSHVVAMMKEQVKQSDVGEGRLVENWSVRLLSTTLDVSDWLPNILSSAKQLQGGLVTKSKTP